MMRLHTRKKLEDAGIIQPEITVRQAKVTAAVESAVLTVDSYDEFADFVYEKIQELDDSGGYDQREIGRDIKKLGYEMDDINIAIGILVRQKRIVFLG